MDMWKSVTDDSPSGSICANSEQRSVQVIHEMCDNDGALLMMEEVKRSQGKGKKNYGGRSISDKLRGGGGVTYSFFLDISKKTKQTKTSNQLVFRLVSDLM